MRSTVFSAEPPIAAEHALTRITVPKRQRANTVRHTIDRCTTAMLRVYGVCIAFNATIVSI